MLIRTPLPVTVVNELPEWLTAIVVPVGSALLAALIVFWGLYLDRRRRDKLRRATFVDELSQLLIAAARIDQLRSTDPDVVARDGMASNVYRVRAIAQMKEKDRPVYIFASSLAGKIMDGGIDQPQMNAAYGIDSLLGWLEGRMSTKTFIERNRFPA